MASEEIQPLWTAQLRASLTQIYEKCAVGVPTPLQRSSALRPLLAASASHLETEMEAAAASAAVVAVSGAAAVTTSGGDAATSGGGAEASKDTKIETQGPHSSESDLSNNVA